MSRHEPTRRILRLQKEVLKTIRADVRQSIGERTPELKRYYAAYKREFSDPGKASSRKALLEQLHEVEIMLVGDYHSFERSQRTALALMKDLADQGSSLVIGLEMFASDYQPVLDRFLLGEIDERELMVLTEYKENWNFPWRHFQPIVAFAQERGFPLLALNLRGETKLRTRDEHAATLIAQAAALHSEKQICVLYGDLHLASGHIPRALTRALRAHQTQAKVLTIFQNSETLYWRFATKARGNLPDVVELGSDRYCILNAPPWVKLQSYLEWTQGEAEVEEAPGSSTYEQIHAKLRLLANSLEIVIPASVDFTLKTVDDIPDLARRHSVLSVLPPAEKRAVHARILSSRVALWETADGPVLYLPSLAPTVVCEGVAALLLRFCGSPLSSRNADLDPTALITQSALAYFGSKILNPHRKCSLPRDLAALASRKDTSDALPQEKLKKTAARLAVRVLRAQETLSSRGRLPRVRPPSTAGRTRVLLESARAVGFVLGEQLYQAFARGELPLEKLHSFFRASFHEKDSARALYREIVVRLRSQRLAHVSKSDSF